MTTVRHLGFVGGSRGTTHEGPFMVAIRCKNFIMIGIAVFELLLWLNYHHSRLSPIFGTKM